MFKLTFGRETQFQEKVYGHFANLLLKLQVLLLKICHSLQNFVTVDTIVTK